MQAIVDVIEHGAPTCFCNCTQVAEFLVWSDETNLDGEGSDVDPIEACRSHLPDACMAKMAGG